MVNAKLDIAEATKILAKRTSESAGRYFAVAPDDIGIGIGVIYTGVAYPFFDRTSGRFRLISSPIVVLTHECDLDQGNKKTFNNDVLVVPITKIEDLIESISENRHVDQVRSYLDALALEKISQLMYVSPWGHWKNGGVIFLNKISHTVLDAFAPPSVVKIGCLTGYGLTKLHERLSHHLVREKSDRLPLSWPPTADEPVRNRNWLFELFRRFKRCQ